MGSRRREAREGRKTNFIFPRLPSKRGTAEKPFIITVLGSGIQIIKYIPAAAVANRRQTGARAGISSMIPRVAVRPQLRRLRSRLAEVKRVQRYL